MRPIILDGLDAAGKSTLAKKLRDKYGYQIKLKTTGYLGNYDDFEPAVYDRHFPSEWVFPFVYGRKTKLTEDEFKYLINKANKTNTVVVIFLCSDMDIIYERLSNRGEFEYFKEMDDQQKYFKLCAEKLSNKIDTLYIIDIAEKDAYKKLEDWLMNEVEND